MKKKIHNKLHCMREKLRAVFIARKKIREIKIDKPLTIFNMFAFVILIFYEAQKFLTLIINVSPNSSN